MTASHRRATRAGRGVAALLGTGTILALAPAAWGQAMESTKPRVEAVSDPDRLGEITVVARKRAEGVQSVPIPITVITPQELERQNLVNFTNFQTKFPAFSVYLTNPKQLNIGVRGIGNNGFNTDGIDASVGVFVDGVYSGRLGLVSNDFNDIAQVELLRGPQGTLFGKNTTAGAVLINTLLPTFHPEAMAEASVGNQGFHQFKASVSGPLVDDKLAIRLSAFYSDKDGVYRNIYNGKYQNARQGQGLRAQLLGKPIDDLTIRLIATHATQDFATMGPVTLGIYNPAALQARMTAAGYTLLASNAKRREVNIDSPLNALTKLDAISLQEDLDLHDLGTVTSIGAYGRWRCFTNNDNDYTQLDAIRDYGSCNVEEQYSQELRWASKQGGPIDAVVGGFLSRQTLEVDSRIQLGSQYNIWAANPSATQFPTRAGRTWAQGAYAAQLTGAGFRSHAEFDTRTSAIFGNASWHPDAARRLSIDLGLRETWESKRMRYDGVVASNPGGLTTAQLRALSPSGANAQLGNAVEAVKDNSLSGQIGANYKVTPAVMLYVLGARGYKSKGFNLLPENSSNPDPGIANAIALGATQAIKGETADNIEGGIKSEWFDRHLLLNVTAFHTYVQNYQANQSIGVGNTATRFLANVGALVSEGVEVESEAWISQLHLKGFVGYNRAIYGSFRNSVCPAQSTALSCDLTGRQVAWAPKWTSNLTADYTHDVAPDVAVYGVADVNWRSSQNTTITLDPSAQIGAYALGNVRVGTLLRHRSLDLQLWVENVANKVYVTNLLGLTRSTGLIQGYPGNPRTFGGTIRAHF